MDICIWELTRGSDMKIKEQLTHIHQLIHTLTRNIAEIETKKNKVNVRLKREKEWLIDNICDSNERIRGYRTSGYERERLIKEMQQALKGE
ncbi:hypothetical protein LCGC14_0828880 [marine sediment metagenome]|uniref:Uncharacterized protein n=1 Tax=marine sediment metagenome TaxID=412755 RepID=A0A0F9Q1R1_9ZZZZ